MKSSTAVIEKLLLTEKGTGLSEKQNKYLFKVNAAANKMEIKSAVEKTFNVKVTGVNTMNRPGKNKRLRSMQYGQTSMWKRAVVTLREGDKIDLT